MTNQPLLTIPDDQITGHDDDGAANSDESRSTERAGRLLRVQATRSAQQLHELESGLVGLNENGTLQEDRNDARRLIESVRSDLARTQRALQRIDTGKYGRCTTCGEPIALTRLRAIPEAERCTRCA